MSVIALECNLQQMALLMNRQYKTEKKCIGNIGYTVYLNAMRSLASTCEQHSQKDTLSNEIIFF